MIGPESNPRPVAVSDQENGEAARNEYLRHVFSVGGTYAVNTSKDTVDPEGNRQQAQETQHFQLVQVAGTKNRPQLIPTVSSADEVFLTSSLAFEVQRLSVREHPDDDGEVPDNAIDVYADGDPEWTVPHHIGTFKEMISGARRWMTVAKSSLRGCMILCDPEPVKITLNVLDDRCPVLSVIAHLKSQGWERVLKKCVHTSQAITQFDCQACVKCKPYFQCLVVLSKTLPLTSAIPSRECVSFYRLLLRGIQCEPGLPAANYQVILNTDRRARGTN